MTSLIRLVLLAERVYLFASLINPTNSLLGLSQNSAQGSAILQQPDPAQKGFVFWIVVLIESSFNFILWNAQINERGHHIIENPQLSNTFR